MITEDYISFETAKLLKEKGSLIHIPDWYYVKGKLTHHNSINYKEILIEDVITVYTQQIVMKWLREVHKLHIESFITYKNDIPYYQWRIENLKTKDTIVDTPSYSTYEEAIEAAIRYCLENLI